MRRICRGRREVTPVSGFLALLPRGWGCLWRPGPRVVQGAGVPRSSRGGIARHSLFWASGSDTTTTCTTTRNTAFSGSNGECLLVLIFALLLLDLVCPHRSPELVPATTKPPRRLYSLHLVKALCVVLLLPEREVLGVASTLPESQSKRIAQNVQERRLSTGRKKSLFSTIEPLCRFHQYVFLGLRLLPLLQPFLLLGRPTFL